MCFHTWMCLHRPHWVAFIVCVANVNDVLRYANVWCHKVGLYRARTRTRPTRKQTRTRLLSSFAIQIEHEPDVQIRWRLSKLLVFFLLWEINLVICNHGAGIIRHGGDHSSVFVRKTILTSYLCLICKVHDFKSHGFCLDHCLAHSSPNFTSKVDWRA